MTDSKEITKWYGVIANAEPAIASGCCACEVNAQNLEGRKEELEVYLDYSSPDGLSIYDTSKELPNYIDDDPDLFYDLLGFYLNMPIGLSIEETEGNISVVEVFDPQELRLHGYAIDEFGRLVSDAENGPKSMKISDLKRMRERRNG